MTHHEASLSTRNLTISSTHPCLIVYLVDQSGSMADPFGNSPHSKAIEVANAVNDNIYELGLRCIGSNGELKNRFEFAFIRYGTNQNVAESGWEGRLKGKWIASIEEVFEHPLYIEDDKPIWVTSHAGNNTPMTKAFENARLLCQDWINWGNHQSCHPPIIINITDGEATDAGKNSQYLRNEIEQLRALSTQYGSPLVLNVHISGRAAEKVSYPHVMSSEDPFAQLLFEISSPLDTNMIRLAKQKGYQIENHARGYIFNGNGTDLINFLNVGTPQ